MDKIVKQILKEMKIRFPVKPIQENTLVNKPWWTGLPCKKMHYFDLLSMNVNINDISKPWNIQDYINTKIKQNET